MQEKAFLLEKVVKEKLRVLNNSKTRTKEK